MSSADDQPVHAAIDVNVGNIKLIAILDYSCPFNAVHKTVFQKICGEKCEDDNQTYKNVTFELHMSIDNRSVTVMFRVLPDLWADMILGEDFLRPVEGHIHLGLRLFKWSHEDKKVITEMVKNCDNFRAISGGSSSCVSKETNSSEKEEIESTESQKPSNSKKRKRTKNKQSKNNDPSAASDSIDSQLQQLTLDRNGITNKEAMKDEFVKIFITEHYIHDCDGDVLAYYGIYSPQLNINLIKKEEFNTKEKNPLGYHMEALHDAFGEASDHKVTHLHILSQNEDAIKLMIAHQKKYEEDGDMIPEEYPRVWGLHRADDFINYYTACYGIPGFESLKFEYVPYGDEKYEEMVHARRLLDERFCIDNDLELI